MSADLALSLRIAKSLEAKLRLITLDPPRRNEIEPLFTARVVTPIVSEFANALDPERCIVRGHGASPASLVTVAGIRFIPDVELLVDQQRSAAIEVKFLTASSRQHSLTTAIGQAAIYQLSGFRVAIALLLDYETTYYARPQFTREPHDVSIILKRRNHLGQFVGEK